VEHERGGPFLGEKSNEQRNTFQHYCCYDEERNFVRRRGKLDASLGRRLQRELLLEEKVLKTDDPSKIPIGNKKKYPSAWGDVCFLKGEDQAEKAPVLVKVVERGSSPFRPLAG